MSGQNANKPEPARARRRVRRCVMALLLALCTTVAIYVWWSSRTIGVPVSCVETGRYLAGDIMLRLESGSDVLLIGLIDGQQCMDAVRGDTQVAPQPPVYRYSPGPRQLAAVSLDEWNASDATIAARFWNDWSAAPIKLDVRTSVVTFHDRRIMTAGRYPLRVGVSRDGEYVNVLSTNWPPILGGFLMRGTFLRGPFYHEVYERFTGRKVGRTYTLRSSDRGPPGLEQVWSADDKYIVYHDGAGSHLWVVAGPGPVLGRPNAASVPPQDEQPTPPATPPPAPRSP